MQQLYERQKSIEIDHGTWRDLYGCCGPEHPARNPEPGGREREDVETVRMARNADYRQLLPVVGVKRVVDDDGFRTRRGILTAC